MKTTTLITLLLITSQQVLGQMDPSSQDSTLNNLIHPKAYKTCQLGELGEVRKSGSSRQSVILVAGLGFGGEALGGLARHFDSKYTVYSVTPAGFAGTSAPPMPDSGTSYAALSWSKGVATGILKLIEREHLMKPIIVGHFVTGSQVALNLALEHSDKIGKVIIIGGSPYCYYATRKPDGSFDWTTEYKPKQRGKMADEWWAPKWFKTVKKTTWDDNMWTPDDYCKDSLVGKELFRKSADVPLQVMVRYLIEWHALDVSDRFKEMQTPTLVLIPDFKGIETGSDSANASISGSARTKAYLKYFHQAAWNAAKVAGNSLLTVEEIPDTRIFMWYDNPKGVFGAIDTFLSEK